MTNEEELKNCQQRVSELEVENDDLKIENDRMKDALTDIVYDAEKALKS